MTRLAYVGTSLTITEDTVFLDNRPRHAWLAR